MKAVPYLLILALAGCGAEPQGSHNAQAVAPVTVAPDTASPEAVASSLDVGFAAPAFELPGSDGRTHRLVDYAGQHVVIAFFPKAFTGG